MSVDKNKFIQVFDSLSWLCLEGGAMAPKLSLRCLPGVRGGLSSHVGGHPGSTYTALMVAGVIQFRPPPLGTLEYMERPMSASQAKA